MIESNNVANGPNKTPSIVTWVSVIIAILLTFINLNAQSLQAGESIGFFVTTFFFNFLIAYFPLWLLSSFALRSLRVQKKNLIFNSLICVAGTIVFLAVGTAFIKSADNDGDAGSIKSGQKNKPHKQASTSALPSCYSKETELAIKDALKNQPDATIKIELIKFIDATEKSYITDHKTQRECVGRFLLNAGESILDFSLMQYDAQDENFYVEVSESDLSLREYEALKEEKRLEAESQERIMTGDRSPEKYWQIPSKGDLEDLHSGKTEFLLKVSRRAVEVCREAEQVEGRNLLKGNDHERTLDKGLELIKQQRTCFLDGISMVENQLSEEEKVELVSMQIGANMSYLELIAINPSLRSSIALSCQQNEKGIDLLRSLLKEMNGRCPEDRAWVKAQVQNVLGIESKAEAKRPDKVWTEEAMFTPEFREHARQSAEWEENFYVERLAPLIRQLQVEKFKLEQCSKLLSTQKTSISSIEMEIVRDVIEKNTDDAIASANCSGTGVDNFISDSQEIYEQIGESEEGAVLEAAYFSAATKGRDQREKVERNCRNLIESAKAEAAKKLSKPRQINKETCLFE